MVFLQSGQTIPSFQPFVVVTRDGELRAELPTMAEQKNLDATIAKPIETAVTILQQKPTGYSATIAVTTQSVESKGKPVGDVIAISVTVTIVTPNDELAMVTGPRTIAYYSPSHEGGASAADIAAAVINDFTTAQGVKSGDLIQEEQQ
jgi:hypothetical protein